MSFVVYRTIDTVTVDHTGNEHDYKTYATMSAAKAARTRALRANTEFELDIAETGNFRANIEQQVERVNAMTGKTYLEARNTSRACSPSSELYWSM